MVDDEQMIRGALAQTLTGGGLDLVGEAASAKDALRLRWGRNDSDRPVDIGPESPFAARSSHDAPLSGTTPFAESGHHVAAAATGVM